MGEVTCGRRCTPLALGSHGLFLCSRPQMLHHWLAAVLSLETDRSPRKRSHPATKKGAVGVGMGHRGGQRSPIEPPGNLWEEAPQDVAGRLGLCTQGGDTVFAASAPSKRMPPQTRPVLSLGAADRQKEDSSSSVAPRSRHWKASLRCRSQGQSTMRDSACG